MAYQDLTSELRYAFFFDFDFDYCCIKLLDSFFRSLFDKGVELRDRKKVPDLTELCLYTPRPGSATRMAKALYAEESGMRISL